MAPARSVLRAVIVTTLLACATSQDDAPRVTTPDGVIEGVYKHGALQAEYKGIPFARAPTKANDLRWRPPAPNAAYTGVLQAKAFGACCLAMGSGGGGGQSEDCLTLNVFAPAPAQVPAGNLGKLPVMVWIHGGCSTFGCSASGANGTHIVQRDREEKNEGVIVVSVNYRLGVFGFAAGDALKARDPSGSTGNYGIQDQREALRWVARNIAAFGGDADKVTIFGQSSGAGSIAVHLVAEASWPLFKGAVMQSGSFPSWIALSWEATVHNMELVAASTGCSSASDPTACMLALDAATLNSASNLPTPCRDGCSWGPTVDGVEMADYPWWLAWGGKFAPNKLVMHGSTKDDGVGFTALDAEATEEEQTAFWEGQFGDAPGYASPAVVSAELRAIYADNRFPSIQGYSLPYLAAVGAETDFAYGCAAKWTSQAMSAKLKVWEYFWSYCNDPCITFVSHGAEVAYIFYNVEGADFDPPEVKLAGQVVDIWLSFARHGNPNRERPQTPVWRQAKPDKDTLYDIAAPSNFSNILNPDKEECDFWKAVWGFPADHPLMRPPFLNASSSRTFKLGQEVHRRLASKGRFGAKGKAGANLGFGTCLPTWDAAGKAPELKRSAPLTLKRALKGDDTFFDGDGHAKHKDGGELHGSKGSPKGQESFWASGRWGNDRCHELPICRASWDGNAAEIERLLLPKPAGYDDVPAMIDDPEATKPEGWSDEDDGTFDAPMIKNPAYRGPFVVHKVDELDKFGKSPLIAAAWKGRLACVRALLKAGAKTGYRARSGMWKGKSARDVARSKTPWWGENAYSQIVAAIDGATQGQHEEM